LADTAEKDWLRTVTALAKYRTAEYGVRAAIRAVELVGGNGYTEEWPTARLYRDALVLCVWEGPVNIQALELLRMVIGKARGGEVFLARVDAILAALPERLASSTASLHEARDTCAAALVYLRQHPDDGPRHARRLLEAMADCLAAALLLEEAAADLALGDARKALVAARFLALRFGGTPAIGPKSDPAHAEIDRIIGYGTVAL
jgi:Acyl-CoA dehydrogenase, C-terminal domain